MPSLAILVITTFLFNQEDFFILSIQQSLHFWYIGIEENSKHLLEESLALHFHIQLFLNNFIFLQRIFNLGITNNYGSNKIISKNTRKIKWEFLKLWALLACIYVIYAIKDDVSKALCQTGTSRIHPIHDPKWSHHWQLPNAQQPNTHVCQQLANVV